MSVDRFWKPWLCTDHPWVLHQRTGMSSSFTKWIFLILAILSDFFKFSFTNQSSNADMVQDICAITTNVVQFTKWCTSKCLDPADSWSALVGGSAAGCVCSCVDIDFLKLSQSLKLDYFDNRYRSCYYLYLHPSCKLKYIFERTLELPFAPDLLNVSNYRSSPGSLQTWKNDNRQRYRLRKIKHS